MKENFASLQSKVQTFTKLGSKLIKKMSPSEVDWVKTPWFYAYRADMKSCGPEYGFVGSIKVTTSGSRRVRMVAFDDIMKFMAATRPQGSALGLREAADFFANVRCLDP